MSHIGAREMAHSRLSGGEEHLVEVERRGELEADVADQSHPLGATVELVEEGRVGQRAGCDLGEAVKEVGPLETAGVVVVDAGEADDLPAADQRKTEHGSMPPAEVFRSLELADARIGGDVLGVHGLPGLESHAGESQSLDRILGADVLRVGLAVVDAGDAADRVAVQGEDVAVGRGGGGAETVGDALQDFVPVQRRPELDAALHQQAERLVAVLEAFHEQRVLERAGHHLAYAEQEVAVLRVVPPSVVVHVQQADDAVLEHHRYADLALRAGIHVQPSFVVAQAWVVRALDDQR